jgi:hypothetical protein
MVPCHDESPALLSDGLLSQWSRMDAITAMLLGEEPSRTAQQVPVCGRHHTC